MRRLVAAGADPNAVDQGGVTPLHRAVRNRCAAAVRALLDGGADARRKNKRGSTPMQLATQNTGRGGTGSPEAKACRAAFEKLLWASADLAARAGNLNRLAREYRRTERRARALERVLLPELEQAIKIIDEQLEMMEREEAIRTRQSRDAGTVT